MHIVNAAALLHSKISIQFCYVACLLVFSAVSPKLIDKASSTLYISLLLRVPIFSFNLFLSRVRICSKSTTESFESPLSSAYSLICVGRFAFEFWLVIAAAITVGLNLFPTLFWIIRTGRTPPCSEPTTGLHIADVHRLINVLQKFADDGNTVVVIEHNLDLIKTADYIIDLGMEGGDGGGTVIATGTPEEIAQSDISYTGKYLKKML